MSKNTLKTAKSLIISSESHFIRAAQTINGIINGLDSWRGRYGKRQYYNGLKAARWFDQKNKWNERLGEARSNLDNIYSMLQRVRKTLKRKGVSTDTFDSVMVRAHQKIELVNHLLAELDDIDKMASGYVADDPSQLRGLVDEDGNPIVNEKYVSMTKVMSKDHRAQVDTFCDLISRSSAIQPMYHMLVSQVVPLLDSKIDESKGKEDGKQDNVPHTFKEQLISLQQRLSKEKEDNSSYNKWVTSQYKTLSSFSIPHTYLLPQDEPFGVCEMPIVLVNAYLNEDAIKRLVWSGYKVDRVLGNYLIVENALLLGVQSDSNAEGLHKSTYVWKDIQRQWECGEEENTNNTFIAKMKHLSHIFGRDLAPIGPMVRKGAHLYAWLIPYKIIQYRNSGFMLKEWDIQLSS